MDHRDAHVSDITLVIRPAFCSKLPEVVERLTAAGIAVNNVNEDVGVVEGTCSSCNVHSLEKLEFVEAVRTVFSYVADYPPGDPRDLDGPETT